MARTEKSSPFEPHPFVSAIAKGAARPPRVRAIRGYVGESRERGSVRIYLDIELRRFVDVPLDAVVHSERISESAVPLGGIYLWVRADAKIRHHGAWGAEDPTTMATGEEDDPPTTMATGEETGRPLNPFDLVGNPFSGF